MAIKGNKGEWSEIYTLFRLLGEGKVHAGDANLNKLDLYYPILNIIREEVKRYEYKPNTEKNIVIINESGMEYARIPMDKFMEESTSLLDAIKKGGENIEEVDENGDKKKKKKEPAFPIPSTECFMSQVGCTKLKAPSGDKADIHIVIHDLHTNRASLLGFSIKSQLGSSSTLLNASKATNITYKVYGSDITDEEINDINALKDHLSRMKALTSKGLLLKFHDIDNKTFKNNLLFLDTCMPDFISRCLICYSMPNSTSTIKDAVEKVAEENPFNFTGQDVVAFYEHKMKVLLIDSALGMMPNKEWKGRYDANGGYLVVRKDGEIVCYHFYNRNDVEDYLYNNTRFERSSRSRHKYGFLYRAEDGEVYIKLNLQIRFK